MSIKLMSIAWEIDIPQTEKMVLLCLCDYANDKGQCWPSVESLSRKCSVSDRTVQRAIKNLRNIGILIVSQSAGRVANLYTIDLSQPRHSVTPTICHPDTVSPLTPTQCHPNPDTVSPKPSVTVNEPPSDCSSDNELKPEHVAKKWNEIAVSIGLRPIRDLTPERRQLVRARIAQYGIDDFVEVFGKVAASPFLRGERNWRGATFDWVMKKANFQKILEGNYDD